MPMCGCVHTSVCVLRVQRGDTGSLPAAQVLRTELRSFLTAKPPCQSPNVTFDGEEGPSTQPRLAVDSMLQLCLTRARITNGHYHICGLNDTLDDPIPA